MSRNVFKRYRVFQCCTSEKTAFNTPSHSGAVHTARSRRGGRSRLSATAVRGLVSAVFAALLLARPIAAAEVVIASKTDPWTTAIEVHDVRTLPPLGPPYHPGRIFRDLRLPGNVVSFRLDLYMRWQQRPISYLVRCSPSRVDQSMVMVFAGEMPGSGVMPFGAVGRFVGQIGQCRTLRLRD